MRVLIADDESEIRGDLRDMLTNLGYSVIGELPDGESLVKLARELRPDLVITDIKMPDLDGIEAARIITQEQIAPILLLTAYSQRDLVDRAKEAGVVGYLVKPFYENEIVPAIEIALSRFEEFKELKRVTGNLSEALEARKLVDRAKGILMDQQGLSESEAFRKIRGISMNTRKSLKEIAEAIILAQEAKG